MIEGATSLGLRRASHSMLDQCLEFGGLRPLNRASQHFAIHRLPSFDPSASWTLISVDDVWLVRRIALAVVHEGPDWNEHSFGSEGVLDASVAMHLLKDLSSLAVPMFDTRSATIGLDGMCLRLQLWRGTNQQAAVEWWGSAPESWWPVRDFMERAIEAFEAVLPASTYELQVRHPWVA